mgnify:CR=1 FL=1
MKPIVYLSASAGLSEDHGTECTVAIAVAREDGTPCVSKKKVHIPMRPDPDRPYAWAQEALCAIIDGLDCLCDVTINHSPSCLENCHE